MADAEPTVQAVKLDVIVENSQVIIRLTTPGARPLNIPIDAQAAFETGENLARAAHMARFGKPPENADRSYLQDQLRRRVTEDFYKFLHTRLTVVLNSTRERKTMSNRKLAGELLDIVLSKVA